MVMPGTLRNIKTAKRTTGLFQTKARGLIVQRGLACNCATGWRKSFRSTLRPRWTHQAPETN